MFFSLNCQNNSNRGFTSEPCFVFLNVYSPALSPETSGQSTQRDEKIRPEEVTKTFSKTVAIKQQLSISLIVFSFVRRGKRTRVAGFTGIIKVRFNKRRDKWKFSRVWDSLTVDLD